MSKNTICKKIFSKAAEAHRFAIALAGCSVLLACGDPEVRPMPIRTVRPEPVPLPGEKAPLAVSEISKSVIESLPAVHFYADNLIIPPGESMKVKSKVNLPFSVDWYESFGKEKATERVLKDGSFDTTGLRKNTRIQAVAKNNIKTERINFLVGNTKPQLTSIGALKPWGRDFRAEIKGTDPDNDNLRLELEFQPEGIWTEGLYIYVSEEARSQKRTLPVALFDGTDKVYFQFKI